MEENNKKILNRLKRIEGQIHGIHNMVDSNRYCMEVLTQLSSASSAINRVEDIVLRKHLGHCVSSAIKDGSELEKKEKLDEIMKFITTFRGNG